MTLHFFSQDEPGLCHSAMCMLADRVCWPGWSRTLEKHRQRSPRSGLETSVLSNKPP